MFFSSKRDTLEFMLLAVLAEERLYGYAIIKAVAARSEGGVRLTPGVLYPALHDLEKQGLVTADWETVRSARGGDESAGRKRKWYALTAKGKRRWRKHANEHRSLLSMIQSFLPGAEKPEPSP